MKKIIIIALVIVCVALALVIFFATRDNCKDDNLDTYGKPMVLGYTNGASGYFPNYEAYYYNQGSTTRVMGAYETHTSDFAPGTGENVVRDLNAMLDILNASYRSAYCEHCALT